MINKDKFINFFTKIFLKIKHFLYIGYLEIFFILCCIFLYFGPTCYSLDGYYYFAQLVSIFEDGDLDIYNNLANFPVDIPIGNNEWSIGPAIFWSPFYLLGHLLFNIGNFIFPSIKKLFPQDILIFGLDVALVNLGTIFYTYLGLKYLGKALKQYYSEKIPINLILISVFLCTPLVFYALTRPLMAHGISFFLVSILIYLWVKWHNDLTNRQIFWIFLVLGLSSIVRWQNVLFVVIFIPQLKNSIVKWKSENDWLNFFRIFSTNSGIALISFLLAFSPQIIAWWVQFGVLFSPYHTTSQFNLLAPNFYEVWFGLHGFFIWHPIMMIFVFGLLTFFFHKESSRIDGLILLIPFLLQSYLWAIWFAPGAGCSFGMRGLIGCLPLLSFGFANLIMISKKKINNIKKTNIIFGILVCFFILMNLYLFALLNHITGDPTLTCSSHLNLKWFINIDWVKLKNTFLPSFTLEKIIMIVAIIFLIILFSSLLNFYEKSKKNENQHYLLLNKNY